MPSGIRTRLASRARIGSGRHLLVSGARLREGGMVQVPVSTRAAARHGQPAAGAWLAAAPTRLRHVGGLADRILSRNGAAPSGFAACVPQRSLLHGHSDFLCRNSAMYDMLSSQTCRISPRGDMLEGSFVQNRRFATYSTVEGAGFVAYRRQTHARPARVSHIAGRRASSSGAMSYIAESRQRGKPRRGTCSVSSGSLHSSAPHRRRNSKPQAVRPDVQRGCGRACGASSPRYVLRAVSPSILGDAKGALQHVLDVEDDLA